MLINFYTRLCTTLHKFQGLGYKKRAKFTHSFKNSLKKRDDNILRYHFSFYKKNICRKIAQIRFSPFTEQKSTNNVSFFFFFNIPQNIYRDTAHRGVQFAHNHDSRFLYPSRSYTRISIQALRLSFPSTISSHIVLITGDVKVSISRRRSN